MAFNRVPIWYLVTLGQEYHVEEKPTVMLYTYKNRHAGTSSKTETKDTMSLSTAQICYIEFRISFVLSSVSESVRTLLIVSKMFLFRCVSHLLPLPLSSCLGCVPPLIGLPLLRSLLRSVLCGCL